ncbi:MAG: CDGSH iron-sulfur domain-containing protein [Deltaproteobacteria bacterium]|nr:CDGSH iron-sulfur domain-containing protein [Deltaproteobacteria bacterium]
MTNPVRICTRARGPLVVEGDVELLDEAGQPVDLGERKKILLCRCGASKSAPLCDGTHNRIW